MANAYATGFDVRIAMHAGGFVRVSTTENPRKAML
jgi:hypothetical protein